MNQVRGTLPKKPAHRIRELQSWLQELGYEISEGIAEISFSRPGRLESVLAEVTPLVEKAGWDVSRELYLEETHPDLAGKSVYEGGRVLRLYPTH
ncbi:MAG TPA: hypothetical protein GX504_05095 [Clostridia bacterium]|nr:hypothetical protein [Clostridia bacterium]